MKVTVKLFAAARDAVGDEEIELVVPENACVADVKTALVAEHHSLESLIARSLFAVDQQYAAEDRPVDEQSEIALIPPVSGG